MSILRYQSLVRPSEYVTSGRTRMILSEFNGLRGKIFLYHKGYFKNNRVVKFSEVKPCYFLYFFKTVNESIPMYEKISGSFRNIKVVLEKFLDSHKGFRIKKFKRIIFEHFREEHFAQRCRKLIYEPSYSEVFIAHNIALSIEKFSDRYCRLRFLL